MQAIKVTYRGRGYIDFEIYGDENNLYRYYEGESGFKKLFGIGRDNFGKAVRGNARKAVADLVKTVYKNNLPFGMIVEQ